MGGGLGQRGAGGLGLGEPKEREGGSTAWKSGTFGTFEC